jgi:hypothetical protein
MSQAGKQKTIEPTHADDGIEESDVSVEGMVGGERARRAQTLVV